MPSETIAFNKSKLKTPPYDIHTLGDRVLRQMAKRVTKVDAEVRKIVDNMLKTMYSADGIGLAAPQVAIAKQIIVVDIEPDEAANPPLILINPVIRLKGKEICVDQEGCLSIPGVYLDVKRPEMIEVAFKDELGRPQAIRAQGLLSRAIQHEMDHLSGVLFVDRAENALKLNQELTEHGFSRQAVKPVR
ncbi:MAG: peptide deformylase [Thermosynechococcaceae cyanobacterium MS004]|jgi:peptide deformylase|nr:peptide deformylase [Thermosynechococcaceae cyanobacterium MS004]